MTITPKPSEFLISGNVRVADVLASAAKEIDRILYDTGNGGELSSQRRTTALVSLARSLRRLAETIERGEVGRG